MPFTSKADKRASDNRWKKKRREENIARGLTGNGKSRVKPVADSLDSLDAKALQDPVIARGRAGER